MAQRVNRKTQRPAQQAKRSKTWLVVLGLAGAALIAWAAASVGRDASIGKAALDDVSALVALGPRPPDSEAHHQMERIMVDRLKAAGLQVDQDHFTPDTPLGPEAMNNIVGRLPGKGGAAQRTIILATHYDTKVESKFRFVGANNGGSGTGLLLALAPILAKKNYSHNIWLVFLDGEEAFREWTATDSVYGSRHFAEQLKAIGTVPQIGAFILLDMIGDANLDILRDSNSTPWLQDLVWKVAGRLGYSRYFLNTGGPIEDDHIPLLKAGVPSVDVIDLDYGPNQAYWHTAQDTIDKLSAQSLQVVGEVVLETVAELDRNK